MLTDQDKNRLVSVSDTIERINANLIDWSEYRQQTSVEYAASNLEYVAARLRLIRKRALADSEVRRPGKIVRVPGSRFIAGYEELKSPEVLYPGYELTVDALITDLSNTIELFLQEERTIRDWTLNTSKPRYQTVRKITDDERDGLMALIDIKMTIIEERLGIVPETDDTPDDPLGAQYSHRPYWATPEEYRELLTIDVRWARDDILVRYNGGEIDKDQFIAELRECEERFAAKKQETPQ